MEYAREKPSYRVLFVTLSSLAMFCFFFVYDSPSPMYRGLEAVFGQEYKGMHSLLYSAYALPNLILPLLVTAAVKSASTQMMVHTYALILLGQVVFLLGSKMQSFECMVLGRLIIGLGGESFTVAQNRILAGLFSPHEHGLVFSLYLGVARFGTIASYVLLGTLISKGVVWCSALCVGAVAVGSLFCVILDAARDEEADKAIECPEDAADVHHLLPHMFGVAFLVACAVSPFSGSSSVILQKRLRVSHLVSTRLLAMQEGISLVLTVAAGYLTDIFGHRLSCVAVGCMMLASGHAMILLRIPVSYIPCVVLGVAHALIGCCWPCIPLLLPPKRLSVGLALLSCGINLAYTMCPWVLGKMQDPEFALSEYYTVLVGSFAALLALGILMLNCRYSYRLNSRKSILKI